MLWQAKACFNSTIQKHHCDEEFFTMAISPTPLFTAYCNYLSEHHGNLVGTIVAAFREQMPFYRALSEESLQATSLGTLQGLNNALEQHDDRELLQAIAGVVEQRIQSGLEIEDALRVPIIYRQHLIPVLVHALHKQIEHAEAGMVALLQLLDGIEFQIIEMYRQQTTRSNQDRLRLLLDLEAQTAALKASQQEREALQEEVIAAQEAAIRELSTPLIPLADGVVAMPLVGTISTARAQQIMETLLEGIGIHQAHVALIDITGVKVVDTQVADALLRAARAARLLGAQVVLTGIGPEIAQTLVSLGADMSGIATRGTLREGIAFGTGGGV
jgi:anti-anti-sigma regulatory factor